MNYTDFTPTVDYKQVAEPKMPDIVPLNEILKFADIRLENALAEAFRMANVLFGIDDENVSASPGNLYEAAICMRDKADHLAVLLADLNRRFGI